MRDRIDPRLAARINAEALLVEAAYRGERLRIYRMRLQAAIRSVSPLARDLADAHGVGLRGVVEQLRSYADQQQCAELQPAGPPKQHSRGTHRSGRLSLRPYLRPSDQRVSRAVSRTGIVLDGQFGRGQLGFMVARGDLVAAGWLGDCWFNTERDQAHIVLGSDVPETLISAAVGRSIGDIVAHPIFKGRDYPIVRAVRVDDGPAVAFTFHTGKVVFELPWPELLRFDGHGASADGA